MTDVRFVSTRLHSQFGIVAENLSRGKHTLTCELMKDTANPHGGTEFRVISGEFENSASTKGEIGGETRADFARLLTWGSGCALNLISGGTRTRKGTVRNLIERFAERC